MQTAVETPRWEMAVGGLLDDLAAAQSDLLEVLNEKRDALTHLDTGKVDALQAREEEVLRRLQDCQQRRSDLLAEAAEDNAPAASLAGLAEKLPGGRRGPQARRLHETTLKMQLLRNQALTNWVLAQQSLLHIAQMLEIIATGGRLQPTYGKGESPHNRGALVDEAA
jgi:hypothetical protein